MAGTYILSLGQAPDECINPWWLRQGHESVSGGAGSVPVHSPASRGDRRTLPGKGGADAGWRDLATPHCSNSQCLDRRNPGMARRSHEAGQTLPRSPLAWWVLVAGFERRSSPRHSGHDETGETNCRVWKSCRPANHVGRRRDCFLLGAIHAHNTHAGHSHTDPISPHHRLIIASSHFHSINNTLNLFPRQLVSYSQLSSLFVLPHQQR